MQQLQITSPGDNGHYHIAYINSETGAGAMSPGSDGSPAHQLIYDPPRDPVQPSPGRPPQIDPMTGQPAIDPNTGQPDQGEPPNPGDPGKPDGSWIVGPPVDPNAPQAPGAPPMGPGDVRMSAPGMPMGPMTAPQDLHTHTLQDYVAKPPKSTESADDTLKECLALWKEAVEITRDSVKKGREAERFAKGDQWDSDIKRDLESINLAALTMNEISPVIDMLLGYQMEQRTDIRYLPTENGDQRIADMLNVVTKKITDSCYFPREETKVFKDACVPGMGVFNVYMDFNDDPQGVPKIEKFPWDEAFFGPHEKEDLSDCEYTVHGRMMSVAKLEQMYGPKAQDIKENFKAYSSQNPALDPGKNSSTGTHMDYSNAEKTDDTSLPFTVDGTYPLVNVQKKQFRLVRVSRKTYKKVTVIFNEPEEFFLTAYDWKEKDIALAAQIPGFQVFSQVKTRIRITTFCGSVILSDENPADLPVQDFYLVPVYAYRHKGEFWGKVEVAKDPQREVNKRRSQVMDTLNRIGASTIYVEPDTFYTPEELQRYKKDRSKPGAIFTVNDLQRKPEIEAGGEVAASLVQMMQADQQNLQRLMNVIVTQDGANESNSLFLEKKKGKITGNQFLFDNLAFAKQKLGKLLLGLIQRYYPPERIMRILNAQYSRNKFKIAGEDFGDYDKDEILELLKTTDLLEYDVIVTDSAFSASTRLDIAKMLFDLMSKGAAIPPEMPFRFLDMPADIKFEITDSLQKQTQQSVQQATDTSQAEIVKTLIAKGQYTVAPEKAQELGLVPVPGMNPPSTSAPSAPNNTDNTQATEYANNPAGPLAG